MKMHIWKVSYFFIKRLTKIETSLCFMKRHVWRVSYFFIKGLTKIETSSIFLNSHHKILENSNFKFSLYQILKPLQPFWIVTRKFRRKFQKIQISNFHLENSRTWIFTLWNHILQTQPSLLQPIFVYTYIYNTH